MLSYPLRWLAPGVLFAWLVLAGGPAAWAHAVIIASTPAVNATVTGTELPIKLTFNSRIDRERSRLDLVRADGSNVPLRLADDPQPNSLVAVAKGLVPGRYRLRWQVLSVDGHITRGDIPFKVGGEAR